MHPHLLKDIITLERIQRRATSFILNDYYSSYKSRLIKLNLLPLMYLLDYHDLIFFISSFKHRSMHFNITDYLKFSSSNTRSSTYSKLCHVYSSSNKLRNFYFTRLPRIWNSLPVIDLNLSMRTIKQLIKSALWNHFITNFNADDPCTYHFCCPCRNCYSTIHHQNFQVP